MLQEGVCDITPEKTIRTYVTFNKGTIFEVKRVRINNLEVSYKFKCLSDRSVFWAVGEDISTWDIEIL